MRDEVLGLDPTATSVEIRSKYLSLSLDFHPDRCPPTATDADRQQFTRRFLRAKTAYETLKDPVSRREYDQRIGVGVRGGGGAAATGEAVKPSADFSAWSTDSGVPPQYERPRQQGWQRWGANGEGGREQAGEEEEEDEVFWEERGRAGGGGELGRRWRRWRAEARRAARRVFGGSSRSGAAGQPNHGAFGHAVDDDDGLNRDTLVVVGGVWACVAVLGAGAWYWFFHRVEKDPGELARRNAAARAAAAVWDTPHPALDGFAWSVQDQKARLGGLGEVGQAPPLHVWPAAAPGGRGGERVEGGGVAAGASVGGSCTPTGKKEGGEEVEVGGQGDASKEGLERERMASKAEQAMGQQRKEDRPSKTVVVTEPEFVPSRLIIDARIVEFVNKAAERDRLAALAVAAEREGRGEGEGVVRVESGEDGVTS
ncbi:hypothetical protein HDU96_008651 [Phlyctochytrium bullatum]|nr:hypothetical protein HDU96_008651 [Phlyctochytrium bullatum]